MLCPPAPLRILAVSGSRREVAEVAAGGGAGAAWQPPYGSEEPPPASDTGASGRGQQLPALQWCVLGQWLLRLQLDSLDWATWGIQWQKIS